MDNQHGLVVATDVPSFDAEREAALALLDGSRPAPAVAPWAPIRPTTPTHSWTPSRRAQGDPSRQPQCACAASPQCDRPPDDAASGLRGQSAEAQTRGGDLRLGQSDRPLLRKVHRGRATVHRVYTFTNAFYKLLRLRTLLAAAAVP